MLKAIQITSPVGSVEVTYRFGQSLVIEDVHFSSGVNRVEVNAAKSEVFIHQFIMPGDWYELRLKGTEATETFAVAIKCFVGPPPPVYRPCPDCGVLTIENGGYMKFNTNKEAFKTRKQTFDEKARAVELVIDEDSPSQQFIKLGLRAEGFDILDRMTSTSDYYKIATQAEQLKSFER